MVAIGRGAAGFIDPLEMLPEGLDSLAVESSGSIVWRSGNVALIVLSSILATSVALDLMVELNHEDIDSEVTVRAHHHVPLPFEPIT